MKLHGNATKKNVILRLTVLRHHIINHPGCDEETTGSKDNHKHQSDQKDVIITLCFTALLRWLDLAVKHYDAIQTI